MQQKTLGFCLKNPSDKKSRKMEIEEPAPDTTDDLTPWVEK